MDRPGSEAVGIGAEANVKNPELFASAVRLRPNLEACRAALHVATITQVTCSSIHIVAPLSQVFTLLLLKPGHSIMGWTPMALSDVRKSVLHGFRKRLSDIHSFAALLRKAIFSYVHMVDFRKKHLQEQEILLTWHMPNFAAEETWAPQSINWSRNYWTKIVSIPPNSMSSHARRWMIVFNSAHLNTFVHIDFCYPRCFSGFVDRSTDKKWIRTKHLQPWQMWQIWKDTFRENWEITVFQISV